jgi:hypothetical protein
VGAVPLLPESTEYLRDWIRSALRRGGWTLADQVITHRIGERATHWRGAAAESVLIGVLQGNDPAHHLSWIASNRLYYLPLSKTQRRQFNSHLLALYSPTALRSPGAVTHHAVILEVDVVPRESIPTPWAPRRSGAELQVLYRLAELELLRNPIENRNLKGRGQRFSSHRWSSLLAFQRARSLEELLLETEPEWRVYETLQAREIPFALDPGPALTPNPQDPVGRCWFAAPENGPRLRYAGAAGFCVRSSWGPDAYLATPEAAINQFTDLMSSPAPR